MPFDFNILCLMQKKRTKLSFSSSFSVVTNHKNKSDFPKEYHTKWVFMNSCYGYWYYLIPANDKIGDRGCGVYDMCADIRTDVSKKNEFLPRGLMEYASKELHQVVSIKQEYLKDFCKVIDYYLKESPVNMIIFLARCGNQAHGEELDLITGVIPQKTFIKMLLRKELVFNMCYIIRKE